jgi:nitrate reductase gamma subunit
VLSVVLYGCAAIFLCGVSGRVWAWATTPEPFRIPTTCGQQRSLAGIRPARLESPNSSAGVVGRMLLEVVLFRSLFRNTAAGRPDPVVLCPPPIFLERKALWLGAMTFHWALLVIVLRHLRLFVEPVPWIVRAASAADGFFEVGLPPVYATDVLVAGALVYLLFRRLRDPLLRYLSLPADYLALGVLLLIVGSGIAMRHFGRIDLVAVRQYTLAIAAFPAGASPWPALPAGVASPSSTTVPWFVVHVLAVSFLLAILPFSKLMHAAGVWFSPTRNRATDSRRRRHVNRWNAPVPVHGYQEWENEFHEKIRAAGLPLDGEAEGGRR